MKGRSWRGLFISDTQIPFEAPNALKFCKAVQREFGIKNADCYHVGDEVDQYFGSQYNKDPDAYYTPGSEIKISIEKLREWYRAFPWMKLCTSNHGQRWAKKAVEAEIPSQMMKAYQDVLEAPKQWVWKDKWEIDAGKRRIQIIHGMGYAGQSALRNVSLDSGDRCTIMGHLHSHAGILYTKTAFKDVWAMNVGSLISPESFAFQYAKQNRNQAQLGIGVVLDGGLLPIFIPYERGF